MSYYYDTAYCWDCRESKPASEFRNLNKHGDERVCKTCEAARRARATKVQPSVSSIPDGPANGPRKMVNTSHQVATSVPSTRATQERSPVAGALLWVIGVPVAIILVVLLLGFAVWLIPVLMVISIMVFGFFPERH